MPLLRELQAWAWLVFDLALILSDEDNNTLPYSLGVLGFSVLTFYLETQKSKQFNNAAFLYNKGKNKTGFRIKPAVTRHGVGVAVPLYGR